VIEYIKAGNLRALAATSATRLRVLPDVPDRAEFLPGYEATICNGLNARRNTPAEIVEKLNRGDQRCLADSKLIARLAELGAEPLSGSPGDYARLVADETEKWGRSSSVRRDGGLIGSSHCRANIAAGLNQSPGGIQGNAMRLINVDAEWLPLNAETECPRGECA